MQPPPTTYGFGMLRASAVAYQVETAGFVGPRGIEYQLIVQ